MPVCLGVRRWELHFPVNKHDTWSVQAASSLGCSTSGERGSNVQDILQSAPDLPKVLFWWVSQNVPEHNCAPLSYHYRSQMSVISVLDGWWMQFWERWTTLYPRMPHWLWGPCLGILVPLCRLESCTVYLGEPGEMSRVNYDLLLGNSSTAALASSAWNTLPASPSHFLTIFLTFLKSISCLSFN